MTFHESCYLLAFVQNNASAMQQQLQLAHGNAAESELVDETAWIAMYRGRISEGRRLFAEARQLALNHKFEEMAATVDLDEASLEVDLGYAAEARQHVLDALSLAPNSTTIQSTAALALREFQCQPRRHDQLRCSLLRRPGRLYRNGKPDDGAAFFYHAGSSAWSDIQRELHRMDYGGARWRPADIVLTRVHAR
jgi:hypothetical protein